ncbi:type VI secretion system ImpA family N-terminal domain-containing protein [Paraburkholderia sediminicola]|uniref:Type VI secretion system ImpA family N-terminal domain-containing protein n=1 Tax=Paraburkholderia rhynchosiae TaxID=487049 RepID=A0ACC7NJI3_9BURK
MNSKIQKPHQPATVRNPAQHDWMALIDTDAPCGPDLEYDPEFVVLGAKVVLQPEAQYGDFVGSPEPVNWSDVERDCRGLMMRSKDMRLAVLFSRCRARVAGAAGLAEGLGLLAAWLAAFPEAIHPQLAVDNDRDAAQEIRMNALQALTDADGLLADVREIALTRSTATRLQVRDVERAFAHPRPSDALAPESVTRQLEELRAQQPAALGGFDDALASLVAIEAWAREHLSVYAPDLSVLSRLVGRLACGDARAVRPARVTNAANAANAANDDAPRKAQTDADAIGQRDTESNGREPELACRGTSSARSTPADRHAALELIRDARHWFDLHEPSSPVPVLLRRAEQMVGKRYAEVVQAIPAELLVQWDSAEVE